MSDSENIQIVQQIYAALKEGDFETIQSKMADDIDFLYPGPANIPYAGRRKGLDQIIEFFNILGDSVELLQFEVREFIAQGDKVVALGYEKVRGQATNRTFENNWAMVWTIRDGRAVDVDQYHDTAAVLGVFDTD
jgi:uncharacterized protein